MATIQVPNIEVNKLYFLFKRGQQEHISALYDEGEVYINSIDFIRKCDSNEDRTDEDDSLQYREYLGEGLVTVCDIGKDFDKDGLTFNASSMIMKNDHKQKGHIYCLTGIYSNHLIQNDDVVEIDTKSFGDSLIFIHRPKIFLDRINNALKERGFQNMQANEITYYDNEYSGKLGFFRKHERFTRQSEYRIFVPNTTTDPIKLKIGSIQDIAILNPEYVKVLHSDGREQLVSV